MGVHTRRIASEEFTTVFTGALTLTAHPASFVEICRLAQERLWPGAVLSHLTAARLWGFPLHESLHWRLGDRIHLQFPRGPRRRASAHTHTHHGGWGWELSPQGLRVSIVETAVREVAPRLTDAELTEYLRDLATITGPRLANAPGGERRRRMFYTVLLPVPGTPRDESDQAPRRSRPTQRRLHPRANPSAACTPATSPRSCISWACRSR